MTLVLEQMVEMRCEFSGFFGRCHNTIHVNQEDLEKIQTIKREFPNAPARILEKNYILDGESAYCSKHFDYSED